MLDRFCPPTYTDTGEAHYEKQYNKRNLQNLKRKATKLGYILVDKETGSIEALPI